LSDGIFRTNPRDEREKTRIAKQDADAKALKVARTLKNAENWKHLARWHGDGYYELHTEDTGTTPVRLFLTKQLLDDAEDILYR
jgi:hypothetical protein